MIWFLCCKIEFLTPEKALEQVLRWLDQEKEIVEKKETMKEKEQNFHWYREMSSKALMHQTL